MRVLFTKDQIDLQVLRLAEEIRIDYRDTRPILIGILKGCFIFMSDLVKNLNIDLEIDFMVTKSYVNTHTTGKLQVVLDCSSEIKGRHVIIVEDIIDTGLTIRVIKEGLAIRGPESIRVCTLIEKPGPLKAEYVGFRCLNNEFVVGYGLDYNGQYRNLQDIYIYKDREPQT